MIVLLKLYWEQPIWLQYFKKIQTNFQRNYCLCMSFAENICNTHYVADFGYLQCNKHCRFQIICNANCIADCQKICTMQRTLVRRRYYLQPTYRRRMSLPRWFSEQICNAICVADCKRSVDLRCRKICHADFCL